MFKNFKVEFKMVSPVCTIDHILLDSIISAAVAKDILKEEFYSGKNICGTREEIESFLDNILDKEYDVYCTSCGIGDYAEFVGSWTKRWHTKNDDNVYFKKGKHRVDTGAGYYKNYHMKMNLKSYKTVTFYVRGDMEKIKYYLETYITYIGKKGSQGYGKIREMLFEEIEDNYSIIKNDKIMRPIPVRFFNYDKLIDKIITEHAIIPPYWREDERELCIMPEI